MKISSLYLRIKNILFNGFKKIPFVYNVVLSTIYVILLDQGTIKYRLRDYTYYI